jgi:hypothetical protein
MEDLASFIECECKGTTFKIIEGTPEGKWMGFCFSWWAQCTNCEEWIYITGYDPC